MNSDPQQARIYLDSINDPSQMDQEHYMQYILTTVMVKRDLKEDITNYSVIVDAYQYFKEKGDLKNAASAAFYSGWLYLNTDRLGKSLEAFKQSSIDAEKIGDNELAGKSYNNIGYAYYQQDVFDSAIVNYQKALKLYNDIPNSDDKKLVTLLNMSAAYDVVHQYDDAISYGQKCLSLAQTVNNKKYEFESIKNLAICFYEKGDYQKSIEYLESALLLKDFTTEFGLGQMWLSFLNVYNKMHDKASAKPYVELVEASLNTISYPYTLKEMYAALSEYYQQMGDSEESLYYAEKEKIEKEFIKINNRSEDLLQADKNFSLELQKEHDEYFKSSIYLFLTILLVAILVLATFALRIYCKNRRSSQEIKKGIEEYNTLRKRILNKGDGFFSTNQDVENLEKSV